MCYHLNNINLNQHKPQLGQLGMVYVKPQMDPNGAFRNDCRVYQMNSKAKQFGPGFHSSKPWEWSRFQRG